MTKEQKDAYVDAVIYLLQYAKAMESDDVMAKFCLDITKKAEFLYQLKPHLFDCGMRDNLRLHLEMYGNDAKFHTEF